MDIFDSLHNKWEYLSIFQAVVDKHAPMRKVRVRECSSPWITRARNYYCTQHCKTGSIDDWETFKRLRNATNSAIRKAKSEYFEGISYDVARNPSKTWKQQNEVLGRSHNYVKIFPCCRLQWVVMFLMTEPLPRIFLNSLQIAAIVIPVYKDNQP